MRVWHAHLRFVEDHPLTCAPTVHGLSHDREIPLVNPLTVPDQEIIDQVSTALFAHAKMKVILYNYL